MSSHKDEVIERVKKNPQFIELIDGASKFMTASIPPKYSYNFSWLGRPIIQYPQDIVAIQELIWEVEPDLIIEAGVAHGGSLVLSASILAMLEMKESCANKTIFDIFNPKRKVIGLDIDIRSHNKVAIEKHFLSNWITLIEGSSTDASTVIKVKELAKSHSKIMVILDSNHTHEHVLNELTAYCDLVSLNSYCIVFDTVIEDLPSEYNADKPWGPGNNPKTAVWEFLRLNHQFKIDDSIVDKLQITVAPDGFLRRIAT